MKIQLSRKGGFTLTEVMIVVGIIGLLAQMVIPNVMRARSSAQTTTCINNLRQIDAAKQQWGTDHLKPNTTVPLQSDLEPYLQRNASPTLNVCCPADSRQTFVTSYSVGDLQTPPSCVIQPVNHLLP